MYVNKCKKVDSREVNTMESVNKNEFDDARRQWCIDHIDEYIETNDKILEAIAKDAAEYPYKSKSRWPFIKVRR